ncbi:MAG: cell division ATP-binding protein FtsE [Candidatus Marinimicrobia bacterium]|nr:cell division ATP-binding protein FtsE [Candidatus Neomarinimicrobiota bacterium]
MCISYINYFRIVGSVMINFYNVTLKHKNSRGIHNVSFDIEKGQFVYLMGPTGAGKSTIINSIIKSVVPDSGQILVNNYDVSKLSENDLTIFRRDIGMVFQDFKLINDRSIFENVALPLQILGIPKKTIIIKVEEILNKVGLKHKINSMPNELSGGEQQKICVARALIKNPKIVVADEPTGNLDPSSSDDIIDLLEKESKNGTTIIMATHNYPLIENRIKHFIELNNGKVVS